GGEAPARAGASVPRGLSVGGRSDGARWGRHDDPQGSQGGPERSLPVRIRQEIQEMSRGKRIVTLDSRAYGGAAHGHARVREELPRKDRKSYPGRGGIPRARVAPGDGSARPGISRWAPRRGAGRSDDPS